MGKSRSTRIVDRTHTARYSERRFGSALMGGREPTHRVPGARNTARARNLSAGAESSPQHDEGARMGVGAKPEPEPGGLRARLRAWTRSLLCRATARQRAWIVLASFLVCAYAAGVLGYVVTTPEVGVRCAFTPVVNHFY